MSLPVRTLDQLYPDDCFFCARTTREMMRWNVRDVGKLPAYRLDATPAQLLGFAGQMPFVAHEAASTPEITDFMALCGLPRPGRVFRYRTAAEAASLALDLIGQGGKMAYNFGVLPELEAPEGLQTPLKQFARMNDKANLPSLVDPQHLPQRAVYPVGELSELSLKPWAGPVFVKLAGDASAGGGAAVRYCAEQSDLDAVALEFRRRLTCHDTVVLEKDCSVKQSWCVGVCILDGKVESLGASVQLFRAPAQQTGNLLLPDDVPADITQLAADIATRAGRTGFRGIAGFDIGEVPDRQPVVFDLNFRPNSSTGLLLAGRAAQRRTGLPVMQSFFLRHDGPLAELLDAVQGEAAAGRIIPGSVFDAEAYKATVDDPATRSCLDGWFLAESSSETARWPSEVAQRLART
ncbi:hypothetical protein [Anderseniella sp. Alg231-50]|uniref:hypothetical protein n=1 Tax=Anderseniella sp. Alg231-50 TaxID=1922226 RepID=UPI00307C2796